MKKVVKQLTIFLIILLVGITVIPNAHAEGNDIVINTATDLAEAIKNQDDGQTWVIKSGTYDLTEELLVTYADMQYSGQGGWYFPILVDNLTIKGEGNPTITSSYTTPNGNWATQNFFTIVGNNVSVSGLNVQCKETENKAFEVIGNNFSLKNTNIEPRTGNDFSGSLYFSNPGSSATIENVTLEKGFVSFSGADVTSDIDLTNVAINYAGCRNATNSVYKPFNNSTNANVIANGLTVNLAADTADVEGALNALPNGTVVTLEDGEYTGGWELEKSLTIKGASKEGTVIKFDVNNIPDCKAVIAGNSDLKVENLTVSGPSNQHDTLHYGIYGAGNLTVSNVNVKEILCTAGGSICGEQSGHAIYHDAGNTQLVVDNVSITDFQKTGIYDKASGETVITNTTITGVGTQDVIAQNGIRIDAGTATIDNVEISDLQYTGDASCTGIIVRDGVQAKVSRSKLTNVQRPYAFFVLDEARTGTGSIELVDVTIEGRVVSTTLIATLDGSTPVAMVTITLVLEDGVEEVLDQQLAVGGTYDLPTPNTLGYTKDGHTFEGWYLDAELTKAIDQNTVIENDSHHAVYAKWTVNQAATASNGTNGKLTQTDDTTAIMSYMLIGAFALACGAIVGKKRISHN